MSHHGLPVSISHAPQLSTPLSLSMSMSPMPGTPIRHHMSERPPPTDFFEGISSSMASTARGPLSKLTVSSGRVSRSGSPGGHLAAGTQRSATPCDFLRSETPTKDAVSGAKPRRDSAPGEVFFSPGKT